MTSAGRYHGVFYCHHRETRTFHYERDADDPRFVQSLTLRVDEFGNVQRSAEVAYPRRSPTGPAQSEQSQAKIVVSETDFVHQDGTVDATYRLGTPIETRSFELTGFSAPDLEDPWTIDDVDTMVESATQIAFEVAPDPQVLQKRLLSRTQVRYWNDGLTAALPHSQVGTRALVHETWTMAFTAAQIADVLTGLLEGTALTDALSNEGRYVSHDSSWWTRSERATFDATKFYLPVAVDDPFGNETSIVYDDEVLLVAEVTDAAGNTVAAEYDYRVLAPSLVTDPNENRSFAAYDGLGRVTAIAIGGKDGETDPNAQGDTLSNPTQWFTYEPFAWVDDQKPIFVHAFAREQYFPVDANAPIQQAVTYSDGAGNVLMVKVLAEPGLAPARDQNGELVFEGSPPQLVYEDTSPAERWVGTGRTVLDNKGNPVKQYEPFFSDRPDYEDEAELLHIGVTPILHYDPLGRLIRTDHPDGTFDAVEFSPWQTTTHDRNDTVLDSDWYDERDALAGGTAEEDAEKRAATLTADYASNTPTASHTDVLGRPVVVVEHLRDLGQSPPADVFLETRTVLDVSGNVLEVIDARGNTAQTNLHGMLGQVLHTTSVDAGDRWSLGDVGGAPLRLFDGLGRTHRFSYDALRRLTHHYVQPDVGSETLVLRNVYGEVATNPEDDNLRGKLLRQYDGAGLVENVRFSFDGNLVQHERTLVIAFDSVPNWIDLATETTLAGLDTAAASFLETQTHVTEMTFDALGRPVTQTTPDASVTRYTYNEGGLLESVEADVRGASPPTVFVQRIDYDVYGRRGSIDYGNGTTTTYDYDARSFRLRRLHTTRETSPSDALQDLRYFYDPVGNIVEVHDFAQQTVYFDNAEVEPHQLFEYDSLYRLVLARGREHSSLSQPTHSDFTPEPLPHPNDPAPLRNYEQTYAYDEVGNITRMAHHAGNGSFTEIWTRGYDYDGYGNRLRATSLPGDDVEDPETYSATYTHDAHGNMTAMPHLAAIDWDHADRMQHADLGGGGDVYFQYDAQGNRVRKVRVNQSGTAANERVYLGAFELYRERAVDSPAVLGDVDLERETLHVADDTGRIVMVETLTIDEGAPVSSPANISRYQYANHLGTATVEADDDADLISYEEFHPFGTTSYAANDSGIEVSAKRYRYIGKERDEETGLYHCGARYLAAWLGRWTAADPIGLGDGVNRYAYARGNPIALHDPAGTFAKGPQLPKRQAGESEEAYLGRVTEFQRSSEVEQALREPAGRKRKKGRKADENVGRGKGGKGSQPPAAPEPAPPPAPTPPAAPPSPAGTPGGAPEGEPGGRGEGATALEEAAALAAVLAGEKVEFGKGRTRMGLEGGLAPEGTEASAGLVIFTLAVREAFYAAALGVAGRALGAVGGVLRRLGGTRLAAKLDELAEWARATRAKLEEGAKPALAGPGPMGRLEGHREVSVYRPGTGDAITDIDLVEGGILWEEKSVESFMVPDVDAWIEKQVFEKFSRLREARKHLPDYEEAPIGFSFTGDVDEAFFGAVEAAVSNLRRDNPGINILLRRK